MSRDPFCCNGSSKCVGQPGLEDLDEPPFAQRGGLGKVYALFGEELEGIVAELNEVVAA